MAKKNLNRIAVLLLTLTLLLTPVSSVAESHYDLDYFIQIMNLVERNYAYEIEEGKLLQGAIEGLFHALDENSEYYDVEEFQTLLEDLSGDFVGIGVYIKEEDSIIITEPIKGGPADKAGIKSGDKVISVDGESTKGKPLNEVISLIKGEPGTSVKLGIKRERKNIYINIERAEIKINPVEYKILDNKIGYIKISQFNPHTYKNIQSALNKIDKENISNIIIDLRNNPGGLLGEVVKILNLFIPEGPVVHIKYGKGVEQTYYSKLKKPRYNLAVLVNENSASASEIFAGAVQDTKVGTILGVPTYGKGTVQQIIPLYLGDGMRLTIAEYQTPNKRDINGKGLKPDIMVENKSGEKDTQLEKAIEVLLSESKAS